MPENFAATLPAGSEQYFDFNRRLGFTRRAFTDEQGHYDFLVPTGQYLLIAVSSDNAGYHQPLELDADGQNTLIQDFTTSGNLLTASGAAMRSGGGQLLDHAFAPSSPPREGSNACMQCHLPVKQG